MQRRTTDTDEYSDIQIRESGNEIFNKLRLIENTQLQLIQTSPMHRDSSEAAMTTQASRNRQDAHVELRVQARTIERFKDNKTFI